MNKKKITIPIKYQYILLCILPLGVLTLGIFTTYGMYVKLYEKRETIYDDIATVRWEDEQLSSFSEFGRQKEIIESSQEMFDVFTLTKDDKIQLVSFFEEIAEEEGISIEVNTKEENKIFSGKDILVDEEEYELPSYEELIPFDLELHIQGESRNILSFLYRLENAPTYVFFSSVKLQYEVKKENKNPLQGSGLLQTDTNKGDDEGVDTDTDTDTDTGSEFIASGTLSVRTYVRDISSNE